jgi:predicted CXXCH cytochrome family protein
MCLTCHSPHSSDTFWVLNKDQLELCIECHDKVGKTPHAISGFSGKGHPLGRPKKDKKTKELKTPEDPIRKGKPFACSSCHNPHSSDFARLYRYSAKSSMELCGHCHQF